MLVDTGAGQISVSFDVVQELGFSESENKLEFMASEDNTPSDFIMLAY